MLHGFVHVYFFLRGRGDCTQDININRASDRLQKKKVKFRGIFRDKIAGKSANFVGIFRANLAGKQSVKKRHILWLF